VDFSLFTNLQPWQWSLAGLSAVFVGLAKTGFSVVGLLGVPLMALAFGAKASTGVFLPMLMAGDLFGVAYFHRHAAVKQLIRLIPWAVVGLFCGVTLGAGLADTEFKRLLGVIIFVLLGLMIWQDVQKKEWTPPSGWWFPALAGLAAGFTTMVGNAAGPVMTLFLLSMRLPKNVFIGTSAWFYLIINLCKLPLQIFFWHNISVASVSIDLMTIPLIALGAWLGVKLVGKLPERAYKLFIMSATGVSALAMFF